MDRLPNLSVCCVARRKPRKARPTSAHELTPTQLQESEASTATGENIQTKAPKTETAMAADRASGSFMRLPPELRVAIYKELPTKTIYTTMASDAEGKPTVILVLHFVDRAVLASNQKIANESEPEILNSTRRCGPIQIIVGHQYLEYIPLVLTQLRYAQATNAPLLMEDVDRDTYDSLDDQHGAVNNVQVQIWARLANLYTNKNIEIGIWVEPDVPIDEFVANARSYAQTIVDPRWLDWDSMFSAVFDWPSAAAFDHSYYPEDVYTDFERHISVVRHPTPTMLRDQWGVSSFKEAFVRAAANRSRK